MVDLFVFCSGIVVSAVFAMSFGLGGLLLGFASYWTLADIAGLFRLVAEKHLQ